MHNHSYENEFNLHVNEISFSYEKISTKTRFEEEAKDNSEMAYSIVFEMQSSALKYISTSIVLTGHRGNLSQHKTTGQLQNKWIC